MITGVGRGAAMAARAGVVLTLAQSSGAFGENNALSGGIKMGPGIWNHPVNVRPSPSVSIPQGWPLGAGGTITCLTCHEALPDREPSSPRLREMESRNTDGLEFCARCHQGPGSESTRSVHWTVMGSAHARADDRNGAATGGRIDQASRQCLGCHDGISARESPGTPSVRTVAFSVGPQSGDHPIGQDYARAARRRKGSSLRPIQLLPKNIRLPGGQVSCVSCHDLYSGSPNLLAVPIEGSRLCFTCHAMD